MEWSQPTSDKFVSLSSHSSSVIATHLELGPHMSDKCKQVIQIGVLSTIVSCLY